MPIYNPPPTAVPTAHHTTHETGGTDVVAAIDGSVITTGAVAAARGGTGVSTGLTILSASNVTTGTLPVAQLPATVARTDAVNTFSASQTISMATPILTMTDLAAAANQRIFRLYNNSQALTFDCLNDSAGQMAIPLNITRLGDVYVGRDVCVGRDIYEKQRTTPMGHWIDVPFNAANFSATAGGGTWTVGSAAVVRNRYTYFGKTLVWGFYISWFSGSNTLAGTVTSVTMQGIPSLAGSQSSGGIYSVIGGGSPTGATLNAASVSGGISLTKYDGTAIAPGALGLIGTVMFELA